MHLNATLFVFTDASSIDKDALMRALKLVNQADGSLHCLYIHDNLRWSSRLEQLLPDRRVVEATLSQRAEQAVATLINATAPGLSFVFHSRFGHIFLETIRYCLEQSIEAVVKAAQVPSWLDNLFDSEDLHLVRKSQVPVWLTALQHSADIRNVAVALDFDHLQHDESRSLNIKLLKNAVNIAREEHATLHLINVYNTDDVNFVTLWADDPDKLKREFLEDEKITRQSLMQELIDTVTADPQFVLNSLSTKIHLVEGNAKVDIARTVEKLNSPMLVMGSVARTGIAGLLIGNTAESTLLQVKCTVLVMKPDGFITPVSQN